MLRFIQLVGFIFQHIVVLVRFVFVQRQLIRFQQRIVIEFIRFVVGFVVGFVLLVRKQFFRQFLGLIKQRFVER